MNRFVLETNQTQKSTINLPYLRRLDYLCIVGVPSDLDNLEKIFLAAPNLYVLSIEIDCLLNLFNHNDQSFSLVNLLRRYVKTFCIRFENTTIKEFTIEHVDNIAQIFSQVN